MADERDVAQLLRGALKSGSTSIPKPIRFDVGGRQYELVFVKNLTLPRRQVRLKLAPVIRIDISADGDSVDNFIENREAWRQKIDSLLAVSFARQLTAGRYTPVPVEEIFLESEDSSEYDETAKAPKGVWFHDSGIYFPIMADRNNAPLYTLAYYAPVFARHYSSVREFIQENPPPRETFDLPKPSPVETEEEKKLRVNRTKEIRKRQKAQKDRMLKWLARLAQILIEDEDWNIIWKGTVHTGTYSKEEFADKLKTLPDEAHQLLNAWDPNARVDIYYGDNFSAPEDSVSWNFLKTLPYRHAFVSKYGRLFDVNKRRVVELIKEASGGSLKE